VLGGIAAVCFSNLLLEVTLTRIFSATMYYHFTFLAIALALFGMGASGVFVYVRSERFPSDRALDDLARNARRFAATTILAVVYVLANPIDLGLDTGRASQFSTHVLLQLVLLNGVTALPFFFAGMVVSLAILHFREHIGRVYFFDLTGAALAALVAGVLLGALGGPSLVLGVAVLALAGAALFRTPRGAGWLPLGAASALLAANLVWPVVAVSSVKRVKAERDPVLRAWVAWPLPARMVLAALLVGGAGLAMGFLLPLGVRLVADHDPEIIPWGWGVNGATSVIGTVMATMLAVHVGFNATLIVGAALYLVTALAAHRLGRVAGQGQARARPVVTGSP
jgi:hypothetical protein